MAACCAGAPARAEEPWLEEPFRAGPAAVLRASAAKLAGESEENSGWFRLLLDESRWTFEADGRYSVAHRRVLRILSHEGAAEMGSISAQWKPWIEDAPVFRARVVRPDGTVLLLDEKSVTETPASSDPLLFDDRRLLRAPLPGLEPGAVVEWEVVTRRKSAAPAGALGTQPLAFSFPAARIRCRLEAPSTLPFVWKSLGLDLPPRASLVNGRVVRLWERTAVPPLAETEEGLPPDVPVGESVEFGTGTSWGEVAKWYRERVEARIAEGPVPSESLPRGPFPTRLHEAAALAEWVRKEVRYTGLVFGEAAVVPTPPREVARRKFGDCKDQATLLVAALRAHGFDAAVALVHAGEEGDLTPGLPSLEAFDHAIVHVAGLRPEGVFVDTTSRFERLGEVPVHLQGRLALVCRPDAAGLVRIPTAASAANASRTQFVVRALEGGASTAGEKTVYGGAFESSRRETFDGMNDSERKAYFERWARSRFGGGKVLKQSVTDPRDLSGPFTLETQVEKPGLLTSTDERCVFSVGRGLFLANLPDPGEEKRRHDLATLPIRQEFEYTLVPPAGFAPLEVPEAETRDVGPATYSLEASARPDGTVVLRVRVELTLARLTPDEASRLKEAATALTEAEPLSVTFQHGAEVAVARGDVSKGLEVLRAEIRREPASSAPHRRLARLYLAAGLGGAARREAREAVRKEPGSDRAWYLLGFVLEHDTYGRLRRRGWDPVEAEKALRKAIELDPEDPEIRFELVILLEHDLEGRRYADADRLSRALAESKALLEKSPSLTVVARDYAHALLRAGKASEAVAFLEKREDAAQLSALHVAAIAASRGAAKGLEQLRRGSPEPSERRRTAADIGGLLLVLRKYPEAQAFLAEASRGGDGAASAAVQAETAKRLRAFEAPFPMPLAGDPVSAVRALMSEAATPGVDPERLARLYVLPVREARNAAGKRPLEEWVRSQLRAVQQATMSSAVPAAFLRDNALSTELTAEGNAEKGWLVTGTMPAIGQAPTRIRVWVAEEGGMPRIVSDDARARLISWYALDLAAKGDVARARLWLERASVEVGGREEQADLLLDPLLPAVLPGDGAGVREVRAAALAGLSPTPLPDALLEELRSFALEKVDDPVRAALLERALAAREASSSERGSGPDRRLAEEALRLLGAVRKDKASAESATMVEMGLKARLGRISEARAEAEEHARTHVNCRLVGPALVSYRLADADEAGSLEAADALMSRPSPSAGDANTAAWARYVAGRCDEKTLSLARQAVEASRRSNPAVLNTLAAVCAETGRNEEAHALVARSMDLEGIDEPFPGDWLVVGRIRENYGLVDDALEAYSRLAPRGGSRPLPDTVEALGSSRAKALLGRRRKGD
ncbi:MAG: DUF3857 domain-containing protein [Thermoanaerobaculia bacterium]